MRSGLQDASSRAFPPRPKLQLRAEAERAQRDEAAHTPERAESAAELFAQARELLTGTGRGALGLGRRSEPRLGERSGEARRIDLQLGAKQCSQLVRGRARRDADPL